MSKKTGGVLALVALCALSVFLVNCGSSSTRPSGLLYVISQAQSNVSSYAINLSSGGLSLINSNATTCTTMPQTSCGLAVSMLLESTGASAFVLNQGLPNALTVQSGTCPLAPAVPCGIQPTIYPYKVGSDGSFSAPSTAVTWTDQQDNDLAVATVHDPASSLMFVINQGTIPSPTSCPHQPTPISTQNPNGDPNDACPSISVFAVQSGSATLTGNTCQERTGQPCPYRLSRIPTALSVITFTPQGASSAKTLLFVTSNKDLSATHSDNELSVYSVDSSGNLTEEPNSPYTTAPNPGIVLAVNTNPAQQNVGGIFVYVGNQGSVTGAVSEFQLCTTVGVNGCTQPEVDQSELLVVGSPSSVGQNPVAMLVDPTNNFLYVACTGSNQVFGFKMDTGTGKLSGLTPSSQPTGARPVALAMHGDIKGSSRFLYTANNVGSSITGFTVGATTGSMSNGTTTQFLPGSPSGLAAK